MYFFETRMRGRREGNVCIATKKEGGRQSPGHISFSPSSHHFPGAVWVSQLTSDWSESYATALLLKESSGLGPRDSATFAPLAILCAGRLSVLVEVRVDFCHWNFAAPCGQQYLPKYVRTATKILEKSTNKEEFDVDLTIWGVLSFMIFCYVFLCELRGPVWAVGSYSIGPPAGEFPKKHSTKHHE